MKIRQISLEEAKQLLELVRQVEQDAPYMLMEAGERKMTVEQQANMIQKMNSEENSTILIAEEDHQLVGYLFAIGGNARRTRHVVYLVIGIASDYRGRGIGTVLFKELEQWASEHKISRMELTVVTLNKSAVALYEKMGFTIEGTKQRSLLIDGEYYDEYYMAKLL
ncbi:GNAT family N-acetyltransferase [Gracilibacillus sp. S3-1-1]|uniref:GNAT family N-acetyltransferase n=1 Tax=Gracilibacillus pellucidus TaxID=3095368 RepID=A0ACC6M6R3_9BACI|nr:GNAT family N-acetyltransferase [Gracilibacillus sp. S3-1-1]MDX8046663.1 GNAT family N-acetyltransferase [Gracilibacillus sp. S3-1-1]